jgi:hypothetical protein
LTTATRPTAARSRDWTEIIGGARRIPDARGVFRQLFSAAMVRQSKNRPALPGGLLVSPGDYSPSVPMA